MPQLKPPNGMTEAAANEAQAKAALGRSRSFGVPPVRLRAPEKRVVHLGYFGEGA
jgi:hypothetical protein